MRRYFHKIAGIGIGSVLLASGLEIPRATAVIAATPEQRLCGSSVVVVAQVIDGFGRDCRLQQTSECYPRDVVELIVRVSRILGETDQTAVHDGTVVAIETYAAQIEHPERSVDLVPDGNLLVVPARGHPLSNQEVRELFAYRKFIFGINTRTRLPYGATAWDLQREPWIHGVLMNPQGLPCPRPTDASPKTLPR